MGKNPRRVVTLLSSTYEVDLMKPVPIDITSPLNIPFQETEGEICVNRRPMGRLLSPSRYHDYYSIGLGQTVLS